MAAYDQILAERPRQRRAMLGKAAILIRTDRKDGAAQLLPNERPRSRGDWRTITLRMTLLEDREGFRSPWKGFRVLSLMSVFWSNADACGICLQ